MFLVTNPRAKTTRMRRRILSLPTGFRIPKTPSKIKGKILGIIRHQMEKLRLLLDKRFVIFVFLGSLLLSFLLYGNTISGGFVYDDDFYSGREALRDPG